MHVRVCVRHECPDGTLYCSYAVTKEPLATVPPAQVQDFEPSTVQFAAVYVPERMPSSHVRIWLRHAVPAGTLVCVYAVTVPACGMVVPLKVQLLPAPKEHVVAGYVPDRTPSVHVLVCDRHECPDGTLYWLYAVTEAPCATDLPAHVQFL